MNNIFQPDEHNLERAALAVKSGGLVAMPTETVYGLGANVYIAAAVARIFEAKQRPFFDPLISHIAETDFLKTYARTDEQHYGFGPEILARTADHGAQTQRQ